MSNSTSFVARQSLITAGWLNDVDDHVYGVQGFGATGDGTTNDTVALQAAAASGRRVYVPAGTYLVSSPIALSSGTHFVGEGRRSIFKLKNGSNTHVFSTTSATDVGLHNLKIDGNKAGQTSGSVARGAYFLDCNDVVLEDVLIDGCCDHGYFGSTGATTHPLSDSNRTWLTRCTFTNNGTDVGSGAGGSGAAWNGLYLWATDCYAEGNLLAGFKFTGKYVNAKGCYAIDNDSGGFTTGFDSVSEEGSIQVYDACYAMNNGVAYGGDGFRHQGQVDRIIHNDCVSTGNTQAGICFLASSATKPTDVDIFGGFIANNGQSFVASSSISGAGVAVLSTVGTPNVPSNIRLQGVTITDTQGVKTQPYAIEAKQGDSIYIGDGCRLSGNLTSSLSITGTVVTNVNLSTGIVAADFINRSVTAASVTGTLVETDLQSITVPANTFVKGMRFRVRARGTISGTNGTKVIKFYIGNANATISSQTAGETQEWMADGIVEIFGTTSQKAHIRGIEIGGTTVEQMHSSTSNINTAITVKVTGTLGNTGDTITCSSFFFEPVF